MPGARPVAGEAEPAHTGTPARIMDRSIKYGVGVGTEGAAGVVGVRLAEGHAAAPPRRAPYAPRSVGR